MRWVMAAVAVGLVGASAGAEEMARGVVFLDANRNGVRDEGERGLGSVRVSNGREIVLTDGEGRYEIGVDDDSIVFVIKPRGAMVPVDDRNLARFYYVHKPEGSPPDLEFAGVSPTGPLPESIDFPLYQRAEPDSFRVILFGDPQPYSMEQVNEFAHDVVEEVIGEVGDPESPAHGALFGISLGDIVGDDLSLMEPVNDVVATIGIPWVNVHGNHDMNYDVGEDRLADETFERVYGPSTYSFDVGPVHFVVIDNVVYEGRTEEGERGGYHVGLTEEVRTFLENDRDARLGILWARAPGADRREAMAAGRAAAERASQFTVLLMHIPLYEHEEYREIVELTGADFSIGAHWHRQDHFLLALERGGYHHHLVQATASGSWWQGAPDEFGLPHAMMRDGRPNGWSVLEFEGENGRVVDYRVRFKAARRPWSDQMHVWAPDEVRVGESGSVVVVANVYAGSARSVVEMRVRNAAGGEVFGWRVMEAYRGVDPYWAALKAAEESERPPRGDRLTNLSAETTLWRGMLPGNLRAGPHVVEVRATDHFGAVHRDRRVIRVIP